MENDAHILAMTVLAVGIIFGMGALGTAIGFGILGGRFIEVYRCSLWRACSTRWR